MDTMKPPTESFQVPADIMAEIDTSRAAALGMTLQAYRTMLAEETQKHWCVCPANDRQTFAHRDGQRTNRHCVKKHHYHCVLCKKLTQIG
jgi:hypothetical protein